MSLDSYMKKICVVTVHNTTQKLHKYVGPCPFCGGTDRFFASAPTDKYPRGGYRCRPGTGCERHGNLVQLVMELEKCDEATACNIIGVRPPRSYSKEERRLYAITKKYGLDSVSAADEQEAAPVKAFTRKEWSPAVERILQECDAGYDQFPPRYKKYLADHGFNADSVAAFGIRSKIQGRKYSAAKLGLPEHYGDVYAPAGVYFPLRDIHGALFGLKVRQFGMNSKYIEVTRGYRPCVFARPYRANLPMIVVESENDALLLDSIIGEAINIFATGGVSKAFDQVTEKAIKECPWFIIALDADASGQERAHQMQMQYPDSHIAIIPACCKDPSEAQKLGVDLRLWLMSSLPPVLQSRTKAILGLDYPDDVMAKISMTWKVRHAINTDSIAMLPTQESLASELEKLSAGTPVALMFPPHGTWSVAFDGGIFKLDSALAEEGGYDLRPFDLTYITRDPYASHDQLSLLHIEDKVIGSVKALEQYCAHKDKQGHARTFHPDMSNACGLLTAHRLFGKRFASPVTSFVRQLELARPFVINPAGLPYDRKAYVDLLKTWAENEALKGKVSQYRNADQLGKGVLPVNYTEFSTVTGRYTTHDPNTQGIDHRMRDTVFALDGWQYTSIDFHMVQPRLIAAVCGDETFREPFLLGQDYYKFWIRKVLGYDGDITKSMRNFFKVPSLALLYGMGSGTFVDDLLKKAAAASIPEIDALNLDADKLGNVYDNFWKTFPKLAAWDAENKAQARKTGFAMTLSGRPMPLEINDGHCNDSVATCYFAQGTEAEIMLDAIIAFGQQVRAEGMKAYIALCLHDELLICCPDGEVPRVQELSRECLTNAFASRFPDENTDQLLEINSARCWGDLK